jgi:hypothetical protein
MTEQDTINKCEAVVMNAEAAYLEKLTTLLEKERDVSKWPKIQALMAAEMRRLFTGKKKK